MSDWKEFEKICQEYETQQRKAFWSNVLQLFLFSVLMILVLIVVGYVTYQFPKSMEMYFKSIGYFK